MTVVETQEFLRRAKPLMSDSMRADLVAFVAANPEAGEVIPGTGGVRKVRLRRLRKADWLLIGLLILMAVSWVGCCGTAGGGVVGPAQKTYTVTIAASASGATSGTATVTLTVTQ